VVSLPLCAAVNDAAIGLVRADHNGTQMQPPLAQNEVLLCKRPAVAGSVDVGEVVLFRWPFDAGATGVGRVVGTPGDLFINARGRLDRVREAQVYVQVDDADDEEQQQQVKAGGEKAAAGAGSGAAAQGADSVVDSRQFGPVRSLTRKAPGRDKRWHNCNLVHRDRLQSHARALPCAARLHSPCLQLPTTLIVGKPIAVVWPLTRARWLGR
jgi:hypothetical protein